MYISFEQCLSLTYENLSKEEQRIGITDEEIDKFKEILQKKLFNSGRIKYIDFASAHKNYTYGLGSWKNYYTFSFGVYRRSLTKTWERELKDFYSFNLECLLRCLLKSGFSELESKEVITDSISEFLKFYRDSHKINPKKDNIYTLEETALHQRMVNILASQVDQDEVIREEVKKQRLQRRLEKTNSI